MDEEGTEAQSCTVPPGTGRPNHAKITPVRLDPVWVPRMKVKLVLGSVLLVEPAAILAVTAWVMWLAVEDGIDPTIFIVVIVFLTATVMLMFMHLKKIRTIIRESARQSTRDPV